MAESPGNSTLEEILGQYQRSLRERANRSIHQLKCALREGDVTVGEDAPDISCNAPIGNEDNETAWHELQHSHAVNQLKALLRQQASKENEVSPTRRRKMSPLIHITLSSEDMTVKMNGHGGSVPLRKTEDSSTTYIQLYPGLMLRHLELCPWLVLVKGCPYHIFMHSTSKDT